MQQDDGQGNGFFGPYGGRFVSDELAPALEELDKAFRHFIDDKEFLDELADLQANFIGRPTPLLFARNATKALGGAQIYLKLEGLANTGAHKINNALGQALLAKKMGKTRIIAETGAGQHGMASACASTIMGLDCTVYMGEVDIARQHPNVFWMELFGAEVVPVGQGTKTLTDAVDAAIAEWAGRSDTTHYLLGSAVGPHPYPDIVRTFQSVIGREVRQQLDARGVGLPDVMIACVGGGSNAMGFFTDFLDEPSVRMIGVEAGGRSDQPGDHAARIAGGKGTPGTNQGYHSLFLQDDDGNVLPTHSVSAGLDYAGVGPQLVHLYELDRLEFTKAMDTEVVDALRFFARHEGIIAALESSHALAEAIKLAPTLPADQRIVVNVSGRGDKDIFITAAAVNREGKWIDFLRQEVARYEDEVARGLVKE